MKPIHPIYLPPLYQEAADQGRLILRDGSVATVRRAHADDCAALGAFFNHLSPESRYHRFASPAKPNPQTIDELCRDTDPRDSLTLIVTRVVEGAPRIIATGSYLAQTAETAEVAMAVDDEFQGKGLGTLLLERLALLAVMHGFVKFWAVAHADNRPMADIFRHAGFPVDESRDGDMLEFRFSVRPTEQSVARSETVDHVFTTASIRPFFRPQSVAVVGASRDPSSIGYRILESLVVNRFNGPVYPVNPKAPVILSMRAYPNVRALPEPVDLAVIVVPKDAVLDVVHDCAARGVRAVVVISAGFAEVGGDGRALQSRLVDAVRGYGMRLIGPNCLGLVNTDPSVRLNASFSPVHPPPGRVAMSSQSGALGIAVLALARRMHLGLSSFVSIGNKADVSGNDLIQYWEHDDATGVILLYLESFGNPRRFARIARRVTRTKPIIAVKSGRTTAGKRAAGSHTAALAASDVAVDALFQQTGVIRAETLEDMFDVAAALAIQPLPMGRRVAIVTNAGGPGILCADTCETGGLDVVSLSDAVQSTLAAFLPAAASLKNPVDMIASASPEHYRRTIATILPSPDIDAVIVIHIPVGTATPESIVDGIRAGIAEGRAAGGASKPVLSCLMGEEGFLPPVAVETEHVPVFLFPERAARVLVTMTAYAEWRRKPQGLVVDFDDAEVERARAVCRRALADRGPGWLSAADTAALFEAMRLPMTPSRTARTPDEAAAAARELGYPVAVKLVSSRITHKTEHGGVALNLRSDEDVRRAVEDMRRRLDAAGERDAMDGVLVQPMVRGGVELMVGMVEDPSFGPLVAFGLGGVHVEVLRDVSFRVTPITDRDAREMVREIRGFRLLEGFRGAPPADLEAIEELLLRVSLLVEEVPEIVELDINPVIAMPPGQGCRIVDARIRVESPAQKPALRYARAVAREPAVSAREAVTSEPAAGS